MLSYKKSTTPVTVTRPTRITKEKAIKNIRSSINIKPKSPRVFKASQEYSPRSSRLISPLLSSSLFNDSDVLETSQRDLNYQEYRLSFIDNINKRIKTAVTRILAEKKDKANAEEFSTAVAVCVLVKKLDISTTPFSIPILSLLLDVTLRNIFFRWN